MCGIAGSIGPSHPDPARIDATKKALARRGPDGSGHVLCEAGQHRVCLVHTRLAIIDLDPRANQPFEQDGLVLVFNGEIYNYIEVRRELEGLGRSFTTDSDTEVLLQAYRHWGTDAFDRLEGMWAFAIFERSIHQLLLCRDRFGEKPLYLWHEGGTLYFASEIKALAALSGKTPSVNETQVLRYLVNGYKFLYKHGETFFAGVTELPPAHFALLSEPKFGASVAYWRLEYRPQPINWPDAVAIAKDHLVRSVDIRQRADVPVAFCLSGGVDSATLAAIAAKHLGRRIHCFSILDTDERYDERENILAVVEAIDCEHVTIETSRRDFLPRMRELVAYHDAPVVTISYFLHAFLSEAISERGYKVAVAGTAADEMFTGYYDHYSMWLAHMHRRSAEAADIDFAALVEDWKNGMGRFVQNPDLQDPKAFVVNPGQRSHTLLDRDLFESFLTVPYREEFSEKPYCDDLLRNRMMNELFEEVVPVILHDDDRNSMFFSVENRSPYLDRHLTEFLYTVPSEHLIGDGYQKRILREIGKGLVPDTVRLDKRKRGFNASIESLIDRGDAQTREYLLGDSPIFDFVKRQSVAEFIEQPMATNSFSKFLFSFVSAKMFLEHAKADLSE